MSLGNYSRQLVSADIVEQRISKRNEDNVWNYVLEFNRQLTKNTINSDNSINVKVKFVITDEMVTKIVDLYEAQNWSVTHIKFKDANDRDPGSTEITFQA